MFETNWDLPDPLLRVFKCLPALNDLIPVVELLLKTPDAFPAILPSATPTSSFYTIPAKNNMEVYARQAFFLIEQIVKSVNLVG